MKRVRESRWGWRSVVSTKILMLISLVVTFNIVASAEELRLVGVASKDPDDMVSDKIIVRTAHDNFVIDPKKLSAEARRSLTSPTAGSSIQTFNVPSSAVASRAPAKIAFSTNAGEQIEADVEIRGNCSELPVSVGDLTQLATKSTDMLDFLNKIPEGSLQGFTFVTNSLSLHRPVSPTWPRVLRMSMDGKTTISFVCDPKNPTYGKVEILHFDDATNQLKATEIDFGNPQNPVPRNERVHSNPQNCASCHAGSNIGGATSLKHVWPEYFQWSDCRADRGIRIYGGNDDNMEPGKYRYTEGFPSKARSGCTPEDDAATTAQEQKDFENFRAVQKENACFNTLPWPKIPKGKENEAPYSKFKKYPYASDGLEFGDGSGYMRTNMRITETYARLLAKRIFGAMKRSPEFDRLKYVVAMESLCPTDEAIPRLAAKFFPGLDSKSKAAGAYDNDPSKASPLLYELGRRSGLSATDWTMEFREKDVARYETGSFGVDKLVAGLMAKEFENGYEDELDYQRVARNLGMGKAFSCLDEIASPPFPFMAKKLCTMLKSRAESALATTEAKGPCLHCATSPALPSVGLDTLKTASAAAKDILDLQAIDRGRALVEEDSKGKCVRCHSASATTLPLDFRFIPSVKDPKREESIALLRTRAKEDLLDRFERRLITEKSMPPMANDLTDNDRRDIRAYLRSLIR